MNGSIIRTACSMGVATLLIQQIASFFWGGAPPESAPMVSLLFPILWLFFLLFHIGVLQLSKSHARLFITYYMGLLGMKVFLIMLSVLFYGYFIPEGLPTFVSILLPQYAVLTAIEVTETFRFLKRKDREAKKEEEG